MTRSVHDLGDGHVARDQPAGDRVRPRRLVAVRAGRGRPGRRRARPHPDPGAVPRLRGQLPRGQRGGAGDRRRHHGRLARADLDRGHLQHDHHGRGDDRGGGRRGRSRRVAARAPVDDRRGGPGAARRRRTVAARRRPRMARSAVRVRPLGARTGPPRRRLGAARVPTATGRSSRRGAPCSRSTRRCSC